VIALDTNILVYAHRKDSEWHGAAKECVRVLAEGRAAWAIPWPCIHEFFAIVTHPRIYAPPTPIETALDQIDAWIESPRLVLLAETAIHWSELKRLALAGRIAGPQIHDARVAAQCLQHGVTEFWSADRDFSRYPGFNVRNPLVG
jgi:toxin-antitoxin system PIN domain toxin